jgi:hypothetical protein
MASDGDSPSPTKGSDLVTHPRHTLRTVRRVGRTDEVDAKPVSPSDHLLELGEHCLGPGPPDGVVAVAARLRYITGDRVAGYRTAV